MYAEEKARYTNEQFIEVFDVDLINISQDPPNFILTEMDLVDKEKLEFEEMRQRFGIEALSSPRALKEHLKESNIPMYQLYYFCNYGPLISPKSKFTKLSIIKGEK
jgi:hypothetical protein